MKLDKMFEKSFSAVTPLKTDEEIFRCVMERTESMNKNKKRSVRKIVVIAVAAAAVLSLGITAAANFDLASLLTKTVNDRAKDMDDFSDEYYKDLPNFYPEISEINIPESTTVVTTSAPKTDIPEQNTEKTPTIAERITFETEKLIECDGYDIKVKGYAYDGSAAQIFMDIILDKDGKYYENGKPTAMNGSDLFMAISSIPSGGTGRAVSINDNVITYCSIINFKHRNRNFNADDVIVCILPPDKTDSLPDCFDDETYSFKLEMPEIDDLIYEKEMDIEMELVGYGTAKLKKIRISPLQIHFTFDKKPPCEENIIEKPCFVTLKNGEVIDLSFSGGGTTDYGDHYELHISSGSMTILDINEIKSVQLYNEVFEIN